MDLEKMRDDIFAEVDLLRGKIGSLSGDTARRVSARLDRIVEEVTAYIHDIRTYTGFGPPPMDIGYSLSFETYNLREISRRVKDDVKFDITSCASHIEDILGLR